MGSRIGNNLKIILLIFGVFSLGSMVFTNNHAWATHLSDELKWQIVFISSNSGCGNYHYQILNKHYEIAEAYLNEYEIDNVPYDPLCIPQINYPIDYEKPTDLDLFILIYDKNLGRQVLQSNEVGGFYKHFGPDLTTNHLIVFCDCPTFNFSDPVYILSHELSHFALLYLGYDTTVIEDLVHTNDEKFDSCRDNWSDSCSSVVLKLRTKTNAYTYSVMPVYQPAIDGKVVTPASTTLTDDFLTLSKLITKWWSTGEAVNNEEYAQAIQIIGSNGDLYTSNGYVEFFDDPIKSELTWDEHLYGEIKFDSNQMNALVPFKLKSEEEIKAQIEDNLSNLPDWFKQTALWWASGEISDEEFVQTINFLKEQGVIDPYYDYRFLIGP